MHEPGLKFSLISLLLSSFLLHSLFYPSLFFFFLFFLLCHMLIVKVFGGFLSSLYELKVYDQLSLANYDL